MEKGEVYNNSDNSLVIVNDSDKGHILVLDKNMTLKEMPYEEFKDEGYHLANRDNGLDKVVDFINEQISINDYMTSSIKELKEAIASLDEELKESSLSNNLEEIEVGGIYRDRFDTNPILQKFAIVTYKDEEYVAGIEFGDSMASFQKYNYLFKMKYEKCEDGSIKVNEKLLKLAKELLNVELSCNPELDKLRNEFDAKKCQKNFIRIYNESMWL